jgi:protoporphyrinogen oxidase
VVLERGVRPGGLVQTSGFDGYWFDHVLHLLYFSDEETEAYVREMLGDQLAWCPPEAWVETAIGTVRYPFQMHLAGLGPEAADRCVQDLIEALRAPRDRPPENFEEMLLATFGRGMCELFLFPYNRKVWKRPLTTLAPAGFQWTITHPDLDEVRRGAVTPSAQFPPYNARGWYPRPPLGSAVRGMEVLTRALAARVVDLRLGYHVESIDLDSRTVAASDGAGRRLFRYRDACVSTLPLPQLLAMCHPIPASLRVAADGLIRNRVVTVMLAIRGPRPSSGHWRYYADPTVVFNRLVFMHAFDPDTAPADGWGMLAEITEPAELPPTPEDEIVRRVQADLHRVMPLPEGTSIVGARALCIDPAYVVFTHTSARTTAMALEFLRSRGVEPLGRYGRWEYSSMGQVMRDAFCWAASIRETT